MSGAGRRQPRRAGHQQPPAQPMPTNPYDDQFGVQSSGYYTMDYYSQQDQAPQNPAPQMFQEPIPPQQATSPFFTNDSIYGQSVPPAGPFAGQSGSIPSFGGFTMGQPGDSASGFSQQQFFMQAGSQYIADQGTAIADTYIKNFTAKSKSWVGSHLKYYFAVDTAYVIKKLLLIFFPFTHKDWTVKYQQTNEPVAPKDDLNAPDLYIPAMAIVTYVLVAGYLLGIDGSFSPEKLGLQASSAVTLLLVEVFAIMITLYLSSINCALNFFHLISYCSYKFVCMIGALLASLVINSTAYYVVLGYSILSLGFFLMRSLHVAIQTTTTGHSARNGLHVVLIVCGIQAVVMYFLTRHLVGLNTTGIASTLLPKI